MSRKMFATVFAAAITLSAGFVVAAAPPEPVGISLLRIEMKKALMQQDAAPKMTQLRQKKWQDLQAAGKTDDAADAEVDYIQAQAAEALANLSVKELDLQLKDALKAAAQPPAQPYTPQPNAPQPGPPQDQEPVASPTEIALLQIDLQKSQVQADAAKKIADNRQAVFAAKQARGDAKGTLADSEADALATQTNARLAGLDVEACQMRLDAAMKSTIPKK